MISALAATMCSMGGVLGDRMNLKLEFNNFSEFLAFAKVNPTDPKRKQAAVFLDYALDADPQDSTHTKVVKCVIATYRGFDYIASCVIPVAADPAPGQLEKVMAEAEQVCRDNSVLYSHGVWKIIV